MPKKKTTTVTEEIDETPKEQELDYTKDIKDKSFEQVAEPPKDEPKDEPKEEPKADETPETPPFDPEAFKKEVAEQTRKEILDSLKGDTQKETEQNVDEYQQYQEKFFKDNNRQPTWFEVAKFMQDQTLKTLEQKQEEQIKKQDEEKTKQQEAVQKNNDETNKYVEATLNELYDTDKLPKIQDKNNKTDYGLRVQSALLNRVVEVNTKRIEAKQTPKTIKEIFYEDFEMPRRDVEGAEAPVNMGRGAYTPDESQEIDYQRDIQGRTIRGMIQQAFKKR